MERELIETATRNGDEYKLYSLNENDPDIKLFNSGMYFRRFLMTKNNHPQYLIGFYQDGDIWSEDEIFGTKIIDLATLKEDKYDCYTAYGIDIGWFIDVDITDVLHTWKTETIEEAFVY